MASSALASTGNQDVTLETSCPGCSGPSFRVIAGQDFLSHCDDCGMVFDNPRPSAKAIKSYYSQNGKYDHWLANLSRREQLWQRRLRKMRQHSKSGSLLDIGTGIAQFLSLAQDYSPKLGTEVSSIAVQIAAERYGIHVFEGDVESLPITQRFDNITCFHVLEHVQRPAMLLARCRELLARNGRLFIAVPNDLGTPRTRLGLRRLQPITLSGEEIHLSHFTPNSLRAVLNRAGFSVAYLSLDPYWDTPERKEFLRYYGMGFLYRVTGINLYSTIWAVATLPPPAI